MLPLNYALALALLTAGGPDEGPLDCKGYGTLLPTLQDVAVSIEVLDKRELRYWLAKYEELPLDLRNIRKRCRELGDAPPLAEHWHFPTRELLIEQKGFNRECHAYLEGQREMDFLRPGWYVERLAELDRLLLIYDKATDVKTEYYYTTVRRGALKDLRELLGWKRYSEGTLPPCVPVNLFRVAN